ncbi:unnamed protein product [Rangifer tarandus platyrhynchus]|uniref:Uncharacterized protein n=1 Tax=Rangifer tarandus platyrhynchus TaxID=3082113 RepID=A0AC60A5D7_RANTA
MAGSTTVIPGFILRLEKRLEPSALLAPKHPALLSKLVTCELLASFGSALKLLVDELKQIPLSFSLS